MYYSVQNNCNITFYPRFTHLEVEYELNSKPIVSSPPGVRLHVFRCARLILRDLIRARKHLFLNQSHVLSVSSTEDFFGIKVAVSSLCHQRKTLPNAAAKEERQISTLRVRGVNQQLMDLGSQKKI